MLLFLLSSLSVSTMICSKAEQMKVLGPIKERLDKAELKKNTAVIKLQYY